MGRERRLIQPQMRLSRRGFLLGSGVSMAVAAAPAGAGPMTLLGAGKPLGNTPLITSTGMGQLTPAGHGGIPTNAASIVSGDPNSEFQVLTGVAWQSAAGMDGASGATSGAPMTTNVITKKGASLALSSYSLLMSDGSTVNITAESSVFDVLTQTDWWDLSNKSVSAAWLVRNNQTIKFRPNVWVNGNFSTRDNNNPFYAQLVYTSPGPIIRSRDPANPAFIYGNLWFQTDYLTFQYIVSPDCATQPNANRVTWDGSRSGYAGKLLTIQGCEFYATPMPLPSDYSGGMATANPPAQANQWPNATCIENGNGVYTGNIKILNSVFQYWQVCFEQNSTPNCSNIQICGNLMGPFYQMPLYIVSDATGSTPQNPTVTITDNVFFGSVAPSGLSSIHQNVCFFDAGPNPDGTNAPLADWTGITFERNIVFQGPLTQDLRCPAINNVNGAVGVMGFLSARSFRQEFTTVTGGVSGNTLTISSGTIPALPAAPAKFYVTWGGIANYDPGAYITGGSGTSYTLSDSSHPIASGTTITIVHDSGYYYSGMSVIGNLFVGCGGGLFFQFQNNKALNIKYNTVLGLGTPTLLPTGNSSEVSIYEAMSGQTGADRNSFVPNTSVTAYNLLEQLNTIPGGDFLSSTGDIQIGFNGASYGGSYGSCFTGVNGAGCVSGAYSMPWNPNWPAWNGTTGLKGRSLTQAMGSIISNVRAMFKILPGSALDQAVAGNPGGYKVGACDGAVTWATGVAPADNASNGVTNVS